MHSFVDNQKRTWVMDVTFGSMKRVKALLDVDLGKLEEGDPPLLTRLGIDIILLCDVIFVLIKPQADKLKVTDKQWAEAMDGAPILAAQNALYEELQDFFRTAGRADIALQLTMQKNIIDQAIGLRVKKLNSTDVPAKVRSIYGDSEGNSPESAE